jgi:hypothetical protein
VAELNGVAPASATPILMGSWMWVQMGLFTSVIPSVAESCAWAFGSVLFLVLGFTRSLRIGLFVFMTILCIVVCLVAFMCLVMKWTFGSVFGSAGPWV